MKPIDIARGTTAWPPAYRWERSSGARALVIGLIAFLTLVDLFATQAILPALVAHYRVTPAAMGLAVNACTLGMAVAGLAIALFSEKIDRRMGIYISLAVLAIPTILLASAPNLTVFASLRVMQGVLMATAFGLTLGYLGEHFRPEMSAGVFAAYITGNVASNLIGRFVAASVTDHAGLAANFYVFAGLNVLGAALCYYAIAQTTPAPAAQIGGASSRFRGITKHLENPPLRAAFLIGFCILFAFIGTFTYVNFVLTEPPLAIGMMALGVVYLVFLPSIVTTLLAGGLVNRFGTRASLWLSLSISAGGLPLLLSSSLAAVLAGMVLVAVGTFCAQAIATGFVGLAARSDHNAASGLYLASYFLGGLIGTAVLGQLFDRFGWLSCVIGIAAALCTAAVLARGLVLAAPLAEAGQNR